jgi:hypothetical protein
MRMIGRSMKTTIRRILEKRKAETYLRNADATSLLQMACGAGGDDQAGLLTVRAMAALAYLRSGDQKSSQNLFSLIAKEAGDSRDNDVRYVKLFARYKLAVIRLALSDARLIELQSRNLGSRRLRRVLKMEEIPEYYAKIGPSVTASMQ